jgi:type II secretory pathway pseudopilin PulG
MKRLLGRLRRNMGDESGMSLIELLVAALMSVIIVGASCAMLISAVKDQPGLSRKSQNVTTARYQLERVVREVRRAVKVETATATEVELLTREHRVSCGGAMQTNSDAAPIQCRVTYSCSGSSCTRTEATETGTVVGTSTVALSGLGDPDVFCFVPSEEEDPSRCGPPRSEEEPPTYVGVNLQVPNPEGPGLLTISDGATLRTMTFG